MTFTKLACLLSLIAGCTKKPDPIDFPVVFESWGSASALLGATENKGVFHIDLKDGLKLIWISVYLYGGPEDIACIAESDMPKEMKEWILANKTASVPQDRLILGDPLFDGEHAWRDYGGVSCLKSSCPHAPDADRKRKEWLRNAPISELRMRFSNFDCSRGYKDIGYIVIILRCVDDNGDSRDLYAILNRSDLKRIEVGEPILHSLRSGHADE